MQSELEIAAKQRNSKILITQMKGEVEYIEKYLEKLKNKLEELEGIVNSL